MEAVENVNEEVITEEDKNLAEVLKTVVVELDAEGNPIKEDVVEPELDEDGNEIAAEKPPWLEDIDESDEPVETAPLGALKYAKQKYKGRLLERDAEIEQLKLENTRLKSSAPVGDILKRPRINDFDTDDEFEDAMDVYEKEKDENNFKRLSQSNSQNTQQERQFKEQNQAVEDHNARADIFIKENKITPEVYLSADENIRQAIEAIRPGEGNQIVDDLIRIIGDDSEKVFLYLGRSKDRLDKLKTALVNDPRGYIAARLVGEMKAVVTKDKIKRNSRAPKPTAHIKGSTASSASSKGLKKKYDAANDDQEKYNISKVARAAGFDTKEW